MKYIFLLLTLSFLTTSCGTAKDVGKILRNEKIRTTDEFLVKKRNPLVLPPNFEEIPTPGSITEKKDNPQDKIKKILKAPESESLNKPSSSIEKSILERIKKK